MMKFKQLTAWLEDNGYYELDYQLGELLVLKANHDHTCYGLPQLDTCYIDGVGVDIQNRIIHLTTSQNNENFSLPGNFSLPKKNQLCKQTDIEPFLVKVDGQDVSFGDIGHSGRRYYLEIDE